MSNFLLLNLVEHTVNTELQKVKKNACVTQLEITRLLL
jgi:hypothetical protein